MPFFLSLDGIVLSFLVLGLGGLLTINLRRFSDFNSSSSLMRALVNFSRGAGETNGERDKVPVSIIVPAKNEEEVIGACIEALVKQNYKRIEVIVVIDDGSSDKTEVIAESLSVKDRRLKVVKAGQKPKGWVGKTWPCWRGYENSCGEVLFFTDADTLLREDCVSFAVYYLFENRYDVLSLAPAVKLGSFWANVIIPHLTLTINTFYPIKKVNSPKEEVAYVFGSFFVIKRECYEKIGGHLSVRDQIVEDRAIGQLAKSSGLKLRMDRAPQLSETLWETKLSSIWEGLQRVFSSPLQKRPWIGFPVGVAGLIITVFPVVTLILYSLVIPARLGSLLVYSIVIVSIIDFSLLVLVLATELKIVSRRGPQYSLLGFIGGAVFFAAMIVAAYKLITRKPIQWRGTNYILD
jgi:chlorobactene glucosyltransferase